LLDREKVDAEYELARLLQEWTLALHMKEDRWISLIAWFGGREPSTKYHRLHCQLRKELAEAAERVRRVNSKLFRFERGFISKEGLKGRPWYKHLGAAPNLQKGMSNLILAVHLMNFGYFTTGYAVMSFPGLHEAIEFEGDEERAIYEVKRLERLIEGLTDAIIL
jgi:N-acetylated-alpha-linked acidic dipeptidase